MMKQRNTLTYADYNVGHPWYYFLGGQIPSLREIQNDARQSDYKGYRCDDIAAADGKSEPARTNALRAIRSDVLIELKRNIAGYRKCALELRRYHAANALPDRPAACGNIHTNISLKYSHLYNDFAHLITLDDLLSKQSDLFGF